MSVEIKGNRLIVHIPNRTVELRGHLDQDYFRVYTESLEGNIELTEENIKAIRAEISKNPFIIID